ncbi:hypothetical protein H257_09005 [Aphanomyces astaci]|uniref:Uncharacterized protein n=1 Tax=Aphanomyces astaci TaxID=112090 RepID=W4GDI1_APHAT|nr:hypothetical protein H257_09005 [Aphanomyces astaci]ETV77109.1 hypothetical protein H257_09005 [Aphanomyces astaci]RQM27336.1 hypothetical protein B5M09_010476 [Aphanomyces astaci]|eukprot:XP_009833415.1 hypothetical protein H257_09005 [Aphanomyces astaci]
MVSAFATTLVAATMALAAATPGKWNCTDSYDGFIPVRIDDNGDVQCWSDNRRNCLIHSDEDSCFKLINNPKSTPPKKPLSCGCQHAEEFWSDGYTEWGDNYWCPRGKKVLNATPPLDRDCNAKPIWKCQD